MKKPRKQQHKRDQVEAKPPGQFVSTDLERQTARFIEEVKGLAQRRREVETEKRSGPPPRSGGDQRSSRR